MSEASQKIVSLKSSPEGTMAFAAAVIVMLVISTVVMLRPETLAMFAGQSQAESHDL